MKHLIVNADDLGLHHGINRGILRCHRHGIVTSASICPNGAAFEDAVRLAKESPELDLGIHLTLVGETPAAPPGQIPTLAHNGHLPRHFTTLFRRLLLRQIREEDLERELTAQMARARDAGLSPSHVDSHQHVHLHPGLLPLVLRVARRFGVHGVRAARNVSPLRHVRPALLVTMSRPGARKARAAGLRGPDTLLGIADSGRLDEARLLRTLERLPTGNSELVCHPGWGDSTISQRYPDWRFRWDQEAAALTSPRVKEVIERRQIRLVTYRDL